MPDRHADHAALAASLRADIAAMIPGRVRDNPDFPLIMSLALLVMRWADEVRAVTRSGTERTPEAEAAATAALDLTGETVDLIATEGARTFIGLGIKALALAWLREGELHEDVAFDAYDAVEDRLAADVRRQVLALDATAAAARGAAR